jgi:hypothetical protein
VAFKVQLLRVQLPAAFKGSIAGGVQCCAFNASRSMPVAFKGFNCRWRSMLRVQCFAFNAWGVHCCAFNCLRRSMLRVQLLRV